MTAAVESWRRVVASPSVVAGREALRRLADTERGPLALYGAYTLVLFLLCLAATFPHEIVLRGLLAHALGPTLGVETRAVGLDWTLAYRIGELRLLQRDAEIETPLLAASAVRVAPSLFGLLRGHPYPLGLRADLYGGAITATFDARPETFHVQVTLNGIDAGRYGGLAPAVEGRLAGRLDGSFELRGDSSKPATQNGALDLRAVGLTLENAKIRGITVPDLHFPEAHLAGSVKGGRLEVTDLVARGQEVSVSGEGNVLLHQPFAASLLSLVLTLRPAPDLPDNLRLALNLIPAEAGANGERRVRVYGTLALPRVGR